MRVTFTNYPRDGADGQPSQSSLATIAAGAAAALIVIVSGYLWYQVSSDRAQAARQASLLEEAKKKIAAEEVLVRTMSGNRETDRGKSTRAAANETEEKRLKDSAAAPAHWESYRFPPPNGGLVVYRIMPDGNPACASYDGGRCLWGMTREEIDFTRVKPLVCGEEHRARFGVTGYENHKHWCNLAKRLRANRR